MLGCVVGGGGRVVWSLGLGWVDCGFESGSFGLGWVGRGFRSGVLAVGGRGLILSNGTVACLMVEGAVGSVEGVV